MVDCTRVWWQFDKDSVTLMLNVCGSMKSMGITVEHLAGMLSLYSGPSEQPALHMVPCKVELRRSASHESKYLQRMQLDQLYHRTKVQHFLGPCEIKALVEELRLKCELFLPS